MDLRQMQYFLRLAEEKNVTRAARQLNIVQPALSMQIAKLEAEFSQKLFDRSAHGVTTTQAGETLVRLLTPLVRDVEYAMQEMARLNGRVSGRVAVGLITSVAQSTMATSSAAVTARYPDVALSACEGLYGNAGGLGALRTIGHRHHQRAAAPSGSVLPPHPRRGNGVRLPQGLDRRGAPRPDVPAPRPL